MSNSANIRSTTPGRLSSAADLTARAETHHSGEVHTNDVIEMPPLDDAEPSSPERSASVSGSDLNEPLLQSTSPGFESGTLTKKTPRRVSFGKSPGATAAAVSVRGKQPPSKLHLKAGKQTSDVQPSGDDDGQPRRVEDDGGRIGRAGTVRGDLTRGRSLSDAETLENTVGLNTDTLPRTPSACKRQLTSKKPHITLHQAIQDNKIEIVSEWLKYNKQHPSRNRRKDKHGFAPVHYAAKFNRPEIMTLLCKEGGVDVCEKTISEEYTALHLAARYNPKHTNPECSRCPRVEIDGEKSRSRVETDGEESSPGVEADNGESSPRVETDGGEIQSILEFLLERDGVHVNVEDKLQITPLHLACQVGNEEAVNLLLKSGKIIDLAPPDVNGDTPLHGACLHGHVKVAKILLDKMKESGKPMAVYIVAKNNLGCLTPFHLACRQGHLDIVTMLYQFSESDEEDFKLIDVVDGENSTPLHLACESNKEEVVKFLVEKSPDMIDKINDNGATPAHIAAQCGRVEVMMELLARYEGGAKKKLVNKIDQYNQTPLHFAAEYGKVDMIEFLLKEGADVNAMDIDNYSPLLTAAEFGQEKAFETLLKNDAFLSAVTKCGKTVLFLAAESNHHNIIMKVITHINSQGDDNSSPDLDINQLCSKVDTCQCNPLHVAAEKGHLEPLKLLLEHAKKLIDEKNVGGKTLMHFAAENGHINIVGLLRQYCPEQVKSADEEGNTPLHLACTNGFVEVAKILMKMEGSDISARNEILWTPIDCAASRGHARVIQELIVAKAEIDPKDKLKTTPLHLAAKRGHVAAVETLIKHKASMSSRDNRGFNALDWAIENGHRDVAEVIIKSPVWKYALRNLTKEQDGKETTPFRKLIQRMPDIAELVLKKCTTNNANKSDVKPASEKYCVTFNYEFLEDRKYAEEWTDADIHIQQSFEETKTKRSSRWFTETSGSRLVHPLQVMVDSKRVDLLKHPLVYKLIERKWNYGQFFFWFMLIFHVTFVVFLTSYALVLLNPVSETCMAVASNQFNLAQTEDIIPVNITNLVAAQNEEAAIDFVINQSNVTEGGVVNISSDVLCTSTVLDALANTSINAICGDCGLTSRRMYFIQAASVIVIFLSLCQIFIAILQFIHKRFVYFADLASWIKIPQIICTFCFAVTLPSMCYCPKEWQWQVGVGAVFLVWADLILYVRKFRVLDTGIYVLMFETIFRRFLRLIILSVLLVSTFGITFYMAFNHLHPFFRNSPFANPFHSIWKIMTMTIGELDYDNTFRQFPEGTDEQILPLPFPEISYILWAIFLILMPILFNNLLVGLAVDDIKGILEVAALTRLTLRVQLILSMEERIHFFERYLNCKKLQQLAEYQCPSVMKVHPYKKSWKSGFSLILRLLRGRDYSSSKHISRVLNPTQTLLEQQTHSLIRELSKIHDTIQQIPKIHDSLHDLQDSMRKLTDKVEALEKASKTDCANSHDD